MKKRTLLFSALAIVVLALGISFLQSQKLREIHIQQQVVIQDSLEEVFEQVAYLNNFPDWSPYLEADPTQEIEITGTDGQVGAQYHWVGNQGEDVGYQEIKEIQPLKYVKMGCEIQKPFTAQPVFEYTFEKEGETIKVTQDFYLSSGAVDAFFMWLFGAKKDMESFNQRGLELLKAAVER